MSFYIIDKQNTVKIYGGYFQIFSQKIFYKINHFSIYEANKEKEVFLFVYDFDDFYNYFKIVDVGFKKVTIVIINPYFLRLLRRTKNINYICVQDFNKNIKKYIKNEVDF